MWLKKSKNLAGDIYGKEEGAADVTHGPKIKCLFSARERLLILRTKLGR